METMVQDARLGTRPQKKIGHNTWLLRKPDGAVALKYHETEVVTWKPDGSIVLDSGGWRTSTTKVRLNYYASLNVYQDNRVWYVKHGGAVYTFKDGMVLKPDGSVEGAGPKASQASREGAKLRGRINRYVKGYMAALAAGKVGAPGAGDCFFCGMVTVEGRIPLGEAQKDTSHLDTHFKERYYVPSLLARAAEVFGVSMAAKDYMAARMTGDSQAAETWGGGICTRQLSSALRRYLYRQLGLAA